MKNPAWIGLGSNIGEGKTTLQHAWKKLGEIPQITLVQLSSPWSSSPVAMESSSWFTNAVGKITTEFPPERLLQVLLETEAYFGRSRSSDAKGYEDRTLDLDLLYFGEKGTTRCTSDSLYLPHPEINKRLFVLQPLLEIEPEWHDPIYQQHIAQMISALQESAAGKEQQLSPGCW